ncbi:unnamed protein product [Spirodela intermedia]|uniref:Glycosyltransferase 61 catalytic domain-containing protein n=1 Tax=Spirodela intermedia TaxID=51605 RepID=A0A7I8KLU4_SPIIN|nr:unnamed protein product [Spirodela intermedia]
MVNWRGSRVRTVAKPLLIVLLINFLSLLYVLRHHPNPSADDSPPIVERFQAENLKPWPTLPSFLPWVPKSNPARGSCEAYFGNGFSRQIEMLKQVEGGSSRGGRGGWFRCSYSETLRSSVCQGGSLRMDPQRIRMSTGGENLEEVMRREEEVELPKFEPGSFQIESGRSGDGKTGGRIMTEEVLDNVVPRGAIHSHTMRHLISSIQIVGPGELQCSQWIDEPTVLVTRFEYANLFHTVTDWYSAYASSRVANLPYRPHLIFVDGHCRTSLEDTWRALFSSVRYAKNFTGPVCFRHAILSPLGYETALFKGLSESFSCRGTRAHVLRDKPNDRRTARLTEFGEMIRAAFGLRTDDPTAPTPLSGSHSILFVRREDYVAHPRHSGRVESRLSNEQEVFDALQSWVARHRSSCNLTLVNGLFAHMEMRDQLQAILGASVVVGAHGAGLTHLVAAGSKTVVLEILSSQYRRPHFQLISEWKGMEYHPINLAGSYADPQVVIDRLTSIMRSLGC